jgi:hypothetical protein
VRDGQHAPSVVGSGPEASARATGTDGWGTATDFRRRDNTTGAGQVESVIASAGRFRTCGWRHVPRGLGSSGSGSQTRERSHGWWHCPPGGSSSPLSVWGSPRHSTCGPDETRGDWRARRRLDSRIYTDTWGQTGKRLATAMPPADEHAPQGQERPCPVCTLPCHRPSQGLRLGRPRLADGEKTCR